MDKEKARFILASFRPDGSDARDPLFAEALHAAAADRELGQWLATHRARDAAFTEALATAPVPGDLRENLLRIFQDSGHTLPQADEFDAPFIGALATIAAPTGLRAEILHAMEIEGEPRRRALPTRRRWMAALASAAALTLGLFIFLGPGNSGASAAVTPAEIREQSLGHLTDPAFSLSEKTNRPAEITAWLQKNFLPLPHRYPEDLKTLKADGCSRITLAPDSVPASMMCFEFPDGTPVFLIIIDRDNLNGSLPDLSQASPATIDGWTSVQWNCPACAYLLITRADPEKLATLLAGN